MGLHARHGTDKSIEEWFMKCMDSWFSSSRSTEVMMRGTANETIDITSLQSNDCIQIVYETGLIEEKNEVYYACSPDGIALVDWMTLEEASGSTPSLVV